MHCFNESAPLANIFDCMKGHNRKLNRLRGREHNGGGAVKRQDKFFIQTDWGHQGRAGGRVGGLVWTRKAAGYIVTVPWLLPLFTQHSTVHNRSCNWWVTAPSNSYGPSIMGLNQTEQEKLGKEMERDGKRWAVEGPILFHYPHNHHAANNGALYNTHFIFLCLLIPAGLLLVCRMLNRLNSNGFFWFTFLRFVILSPTSTCRLLQKSKQARAARSSIKHFDNAA